MRWEATVGRMVWTAVDYDGARFTVNTGPVTVETGPGGGTTMPSGTAGQVPQVSSGSTYVLKTPNTADGLVRLDGDATIPDILIPATIARDSEVVAAIAALSSVYQPVDSDLTAIAALSTTSFGRALLELADAAAARTALGLGTAATAAAGDFQPVDSDLTAIAALSTTSFGRALLTVADLAALHATLGSGTPSISTFLRGDGTWATPAGGSSPLTHIASVGAQTSRDATAMNTGNGAQLIDTAIDLGTASAGDCYHFCGFVSLLNNSGSARNYKPGITLGSTFTQMSANFALNAGASAFVVRIEGNINVVSTSVQQFGVETAHPNSTLAGVAASSATEDFTSAKTLQLHWFCNVSTATQSVQLLSLQVWKVSP